MLHCTPFSMMLRSRLTDLKRGQSVGWKHTYSYWLFLEPNQGYHKTVTSAWMIGNTQISCCKLLSALIILHDPCCLVLQSSWGGNNLLMDTQANKSHKIWSSIKQWHRIMKNSKLNMESLLVGYAWQTQCWDTPKYPMIAHWALLCLKRQKLETWN